MKNRDCLFYVFITILLTYGITQYLTISDILSESNRIINTFHFDYYQKFYSQNIPIPSKNVLDDLMKIRVKINLSQGAHQGYEKLLLCIITSVVLLIAYPISKYRRNKRLKNTPTQPEKP